MTFFSEVFKVLSWIYTQDPMSESLRTSQIKRRWRMAYAGSAMEVIVEDWVMVDSWIIVDNSTVAGSWTVLIDTEVVVIVLLLCQYFPYTFGCSVSFNERNPNSHREWDGSHNRDFNDCR